MIFFFWFANVLLSSLRMGVALFVDSSRIYGEFMDVKGDIDIVTLDKQWFGITVFSVKSHSLSFCSVTRNAVKIYIDVITKKMISLRIYIYMYMYMLSLTTNPQKRALRFLCLDVCLDVA